MDESVRKAAVEAIVVKRDALLAERESLVRERADTERRLKAVESALLDCRSAGRLFDFDLELPESLVKSLTAPRPVASWISALRSNFAGGGEPETGYSFKSVTTKAGPEQSIRQMVIDQLRMAGAGGVKAATIRRVVESTLGRQLHSKTIGMTLYRLTEKGMATREGLIWKWIEVQSRDAGASMRSGN